MQPHSMCAVAIAGYIWNRSRDEEISSCGMEVEYKDRYRETKIKKYNLADIKESDGGRELKVRIMRSGGGLSCTMILRRSTPEEGARVTMTHETIHVAGLREEFKLYKNKVSEGTHYNSRRYRGFGGPIEAGGEKLNLYCEIKTDSGDFITVGYKLRVIV